MEFGFPLWGYMWGVYGRSSRMIEGWCGGGVRFCEVDRYIGELIVGFSN